MMQQSVNDMVADLKKMGATVKVGYEMVSRQHEISQVDDLIRSPLVSIPDKVEAIDSLVLRNVPWGLGRTDQFWDFVYIAWKRLYKNWLTRLSLVEVYGGSKVWVEYNESKVLVDGTVATESKQRAIEPSTLVYLLLHPKLYHEVKVIREEKLSPQIPRFGSPNIDLQQLKHSVYSYGYEHVLQLGEICHNYVYHPQHINVNTVIVLAGMQANAQYNVQPTGGNPQKPSGPRNPGIQET